LTEKLAENNDNVQQEVTLEFKNMSSAFFNGEEIFNDGRYASSSWTLGKLSVYDKLQNHCDSETTQSVNSDGSEYQCIEGYVPIDICHPATSSETFKTLIELRRDLRKRGNFAVFIIHIMLSNQVERAMNQAGRRYRGMKVRNMEEEFEKASEGLINLEKTAKYDEALSTLLLHEAEVYWAQKMLANPWAQNFEDGNIEAHHWREQHRKITKKLEISRVRAQAATLYLNSLEFPEPQTEDASFTENNVKQDEVRTIISMTSTSIVDLMITDFR
jgi:hypothetical protein